MQVVGGTPRRVSRRGLYVCASASAVFVALILAIGGGCRRAEDAGSGGRETAESTPPGDQPQAGEAAERPLTSSRSSPRRRAGALQLKTVEGVVYLSGAAPLTALAIETADRQVMILIGSKAAALRSHHHQKVSLTGFWRPAASANARDTLEVAEYTFLREE